jgi:hypothetical protein
MHYDPELKMQISWRSSKDLAEHVLSISRALRFTDGAGVAFESGSVQRSPGRSSKKHTSLAEEFGPRKLVSATILVRNGTLSDEESKFEIEITLFCVRVTRSVVPSANRDGT